jgi:hypothetical protein
MEGRERDGILEHVSCGEMEGRERDGILVDEVHV